MYKPLSRRRYNHAQRMSCDSPICDRSDCCLKSCWPVLMTVIFLLTGCKVELYSNLSENEVVEIWAILLRQDIDSEKFATRDGTFGVRVEKSQVAEAVETLKGCGYPKKEFENVGGLFKKEGMISSPLEEQARYIYALTQSLGETLSQIDGVITARVHIVLPEEKPFSENIKPSSASVFIKYREGAQLQDIKSEIKLIVSKSIEGLNYNNVVLAMVPAEDTARCGAAEILQAARGPSGS